VCLKDGHFSGFYVCCREFIKNQVKAVACKAVLLAEKRVG
jgi:hypothetical protein